MLNSVNMLNELLGITCGIQRMLGKKKSRTGDVDSI